MQYNVIKMDAKEFQKVFLAFKDVEMTDIHWYAKEQAYIVFKNEKGQTLLFDYSKLHNYFSAEFKTGVSNIRFDYSQNKIDSVYKEFLDNACKDGNSQKASDYL